MLNGRKPNVSCHGGGGREAVRTKGRRSFHLEGQLTQGAED